MQTLNSKRAYPQSRRDCGAEPRVSEPWVIDMFDRPTLKGLRPATGGGETGTKRVAEIRKAHPYRVADLTETRPPGVGRPRAERRNPCGIDRLSENMPFRH